MKPVILAALLLVLAGAWLWGVSGPRHQEAMARAMLSAESTAAVVTPGSEVTATPTDTAQSSLPDPRLWIPLYVCRHGCVATVTHPASGTTSRQTFRSYAECLAYFRRHRHVTNVEIIGRQA